MNSSHFLCQQQKSTFFHACSSCVRFVTELSFAHEQSEVLSQRVVKEIHTAEQVY
jgi:hypothetical protein